MTSFQKTGFGRLKRGCSEITRKSATAAHNTNNQNRKGCEKKKEERLLLELDLLSAGFNFFVVEVQPSRKTGGHETS